MDATHCALTKHQPSLTSKTRVQTLLLSLPKLRTDLKRSFIFTYFSRLPPELRVKIWKIAAQNEPRTIPIHHKTTEGRTVEWRVRNPSAQPYAPGFLTASREARNETLDLYIACKQTFDGLTRVIRINFDIDMFLLPGRGNPGRNWGDQNFDLDVFKSIRNLQYPISGISIAGFLWRNDLWFNLINLRMIYLVPFPSRCTIANITTWNDDGKEKDLNSELQRKNEQDNILDMFEWDFGKRLDRVGDKSKGLPIIDVVWANFGDLDYSLQDRGGKEITMKKPVLNEDS